MSEDDIKYMKQAIEEAKKCKGEDSRTHPSVGAVVVLNGNVIATAHRGEITDGDHAEYTALEKKLSTTSVSGATIYTTLEPCTTRNHPKVPCAYRLSERKVRRVVIGMLDPNPNICGRGLWSLREANVATDLFPHDLMSEIEELNREFIREHRPRHSQNAPRVATATLGSASEEPAKDVEPAKTAVVETTRESRYDAFLNAMKSGDIETGDELYEEMTRSEEKPELKLQLRVLYLDYRYRSTQDPDNLSELEDLVQNDDVGDFAASRLGFLALLAHDLKGAADSFAKTVSLTKSPERKVFWVVEHAHTLLKQEYSLDGMRLLFSHLREDYSREGKAMLLKTLSTFFESRNEKYVSAALLARAAQLVPADNTIRFGAAYALSQIGFGHLSMALYDCLRQLSDRDSVVLNNLGAQCEEYELPIKSVRFFREAANRNNSLAKANLAFKYMDAGFVDEARTLLDSARKEENPHENVGHALVAMAERIKCEEKKWQENLAYGTREQLFLSSFVESLSSPEQGDVSAFTGTWRDADGVELALVVQERSVTGEWQKEYKRMRVTIVPNGNAGFCECEDLGTFVAYDERSKKGFAFLDKSGESLEMLYIDDKKPVLSKWKRTKQLAHPLNAVT
jgi:pyrimidine deaminase RibD-like protein